MSDLKDIFENQETEQEIETEQSEVESQEAEQSKELKGENRESDETPASTKEDKPQEESWTKKAVLDERRKRQELERQLRELQNQVNNPKEEEEIPDPIDDPVGYKDYVKNSLKQEMFAERVNETRIEMEAKHDDYLEMEQKFIELSNDDPKLAKQLRQSSNPAKFAYDTAKRYFESQKFNDPDYQVKLREEIKKEILAELAKNQSISKATSRVNLPDLTSRTSANSNVDPKEEYKGTLEEIFGE